MKIFSHALTLALHLATVSASFFSFFQTPIGKLEDLDVPGDNPLKYCQDPEDHILSIDKADLIGGDIEPGANLTLKISGNLDEDIKNGSSIVFQLKLKTVAGAVPLLKEKASLCEQLDQKCPIDKGSVTLSKNVSIPDDVPKATYLVRFDASNKDEKRITCVEAEVSF